MAASPRGPRDARMDVRLWDEERELIRRAAATRGQSDGDFARETLIEAARETLREAGVTLLSDRDRDRVLALLDGGAPEPAPALLRAVERHREAIG